MTIFSSDEKDIVKIAVLASGRGSNFEALCNGDTGKGRISLLITDNPDAPALAMAEILGVESMYIYPGRFRTKFSPEAELNWIKAMGKRGIGLICLAGLMRIVKKNMLDRYAGRIMNIHPSLLPSFPGLHSQRQALEWEKSPDTRSPARSARGACGPSPLLSVLRVLGEYLFLP